MSMKNSISFFVLTFFCFQTWGQVANPPMQNVPKPIAINWVNRLIGNFLFVNDWSYPPGVEMKMDGRAGCADGGFCPERCSSMLDSNGIVLNDSTQIFYQLLDTTHQPHSICCEARCFEWAGTDFIEVFYKSKDSTFCSTAKDIGTHCSLHLEIINDICIASIELNSIIRNMSDTYYCSGGHISIDKKLWKKGIMKAKFNFNFDNKGESKSTFFWKGNIYAIIGMSICE
jgi:hypothetical protein